MRWWMEVPRQTTGPTSQRWESMPTIYILLLISSRSAVVSSTRKFAWFPKLVLIQAGPAAFFDFVNMKNPDNTIAFTIQPCHTFGAPQVEYLVNSRFPSGNALTVWRVTQSGTSFALTRTNVPTAAYSLGPNATQKGNNDPLKTGDVRVLHAVFRGDSIWCALTTAHNWTSATNTASIHWFQIRAAAPALVQQGVYGAAN